MLRLGAVKACSKCGKAKPETEFYAKGPGLGPRSICKACVSTHNAAYRVANRATALPYAAAYYRSNRGKFRLTRWRQRIGDHVTAEMVADLAAAQGPFCAICGVAKADLPSTNWHLDHDHATGVLRGFLCRHCNHVLGHAKDRPSVLRSAADYLEKDRS